MDCQVAKRQKWSPKMGPPGSQCGGGGDFQRTPDKLRPNIVLICDRVVYGEWTCFNQHGCTMLLPASNITYKLIVNSFVGQVHETVKALAFTTEIELRARFVR